MHLPTRARTAIGLVALLLTTAPAAIAADLVLTGTTGPDIITGTDAAESIYGREGDDTINGGGGDDEIDGGPGADRISGGDGVDAVSYSGTAGVTVTLDGAPGDGALGENDNVNADVEDLYGGDGDDKLTGSPGANTIDGGNGADRIDGGGGPDALFGGEGPDTIDARDGAVDRIECGGGNDTVNVDDIDVVAGDCENVARIAKTGEWGLTLDGRKNRIKLTGVTSKSAVKIWCASCKKGKGDKIAENASANAPGAVASFKLPRKKVLGQTIEIGVRAPGAATVCVRYKVQKKIFKYAEDQKQGCATPAKEA